MFFITKYNRIPKRYLVVFNRFFISFIATYLLVFSNVSLAESSSNLTEIDIERLLATEVVTASKIAQQISDSPSAVSIVTAKDIKSYGYRTLADIINSMRGLNTINDHVYTYMSGRSFGEPGDYPGRVMLLIDGHQANDNLYNAAYLGNDGLLDTELIERVEYVSGPGSVTYGNGAFYGIINIVTKKGHDYNGAQLALDASSYGTYKERLTYGSRLENGANVLLSVSGLHSQGQNLYFSAFNIPSTNFGIAENLDHETNQRIFVKADYEKWGLEIAYVNRVKDDPAAAYGADFNTKPASMQDRNGFINLKYEDDVSPSLKSTISTYYGQYYYRQHAYYSGDFLQEHDNGKWWGTEAKFVYTGLDQHTIVSGLEYRDDFQQDFYLGSGEIQHSTYMLSGYLQDEYRWNRLIKLNAGTRLDYGGPQMKAFSPRLALILSPTDQLEIKGSISSAFRRPNVYERFYDDGVTQLGNPDLKKEQVLAKELVIQYKPDNTSKISASAYTYRTKNLIHNVSSNTVVDAQQFENETKHHSKGIDLEYEKQWSKSTRLRASYAYQDATHADGDWLANLPKHLAKINFAHDLHDNDLMLGLEMQYVSPRLTEAKNLIGGYTITNLTLYNQTLIKNTTISASVKNLFDKAYAVPAPSFYTSDTFDQNGRNFWIQLTYDFK